MNVLGISCAGNTAIKLPWEILDVFAVCWMGFWWVHCPFPCGVLAVFPLGTPPLAPSDSNDVVQAIFHDLEQAAPRTSQENNGDKDSNVEYSPSPPPS